MKDELVDILDEQGNKTGQTMLKSKAHAKSLRHGGAHVWVYNSKGQILLQKRHASKVIRPNVWDVSAAGHIKSGDTPRETIVREAEEELGLQIKPKELKFVGVKEVNEAMPDGTFHRVFNWTYTLLLDMDIKSLRLEVDEVSDIRWIHVDDFEKELNDPLKKKLYTPSRQEFYRQAIEEVRKVGRHG